VVARPETSVVRRRATIQSAPVLVGVVPPSRDSGPRLEHRVRLLTIGLRWVTVILGVIAGVLRSPNLAFLGTAFVLVAFSALVTVRQPHDGDLGVRTGAFVALELVVMVSAVALTGGLESPFILTPLTGLLLAGYAFGRRATIGTTVAGVVAASATIAIQVVEPGAERAASQIAVIYLLSGALGAFTRNLVVEIELHRAAAIDQATQMTTANELLVSLHALSQTLPASFDLADVVTSIRDRLRTLLEFTVLVVLVRDSAASGWRVELAEGVRMPGRLADVDLPRPLRCAVSATRSVVVDDRLVDVDEDGFGALARSGLYAALRIRGELVGMIALEHVPPHAYGADHAELLDNLSSVFALSIDNARWFGRIRSIGAETERARIARELHDRIAQSLAYVTFELERLQRAPGEKRDELGALHEIVRGIVRELRETIYQLRANISEDADLVTVAADYLVRWAERTGIRVVWTPATDDRLPHRVEQELWRILQEAVANVERHAHAHQVVVSWEVSGANARLAIADDGRGFDPDRVTGEHYGLVGMQERADAIGARLRVETRPGGGTQVIVDLELAQVGADGRDRRSA
jgi:signal transduction histidine kinase